MGSGPCLLAAGQEGRRGRTRAVKSIAPVARDTVLGLDSGHMGSQDTPRNIGRNKNLGLET